MALAWPPVGLPKKSSTRNALPRLPAAEAEEAAAAEAAGAGAAAAPETDAAATPTLDG